MDNQLQIFENEEFGEVRTIEENGQILFCGSDVAKALGYAKPQNAIDTHCRYTLKRGIPHPQSPIKTIEMNFIPEGDLYRLIANSKLPSAEQFEKWVFDEILPSIRKHGAYMTPTTIENLLANPDSVIKLFTALKEEREQKEQLQIQVIENEPKVLFADSVAISDGTILIRELAKILKGNGIDIGEKRLFTQLRDDGFLIKKKGTDYNSPTQKAMELGLFKIKESTTTHPDGDVIIHKTTMVTGKGQQYFVNRFLNKEKYS